MLARLDRVNAALGLVGRDLSLPAWGRFCLGAGASMLCLATSIICVAALGWVVGLPIGRWTLPAAVAVTALATIAWIRREAPTHVGRVIAGIVAIGGVAFGLGLATERVLDQSFDGQWYHQEAVIQLAGGWNPLAGPLSADRVPPLNARSRIDGYGKASWVYGAAVYAVSGRLGHAKAFGPWLVIAAFLVTAAALSGLPRWLALTSAAVAAVSPTVILQLLSHQVDGELGCALLVCIAALVLWLRTGDGLSLAVLAMALVLGVNLKQTGPAFLAVLVGGGSVALLLVDRHRLQPRFIATVTASVAVALLGVGFNPYVSNWLHYGDVLYPYRGPVATVAPLPDDAGGADTLFLAAFSRSTQETDIFTSYHRLVTGRDLKLPFTVGLAEIRAFNDPDPRIGGWGPLYSGMTVLALVTAAACWRRWRHLAVWAMVSSTILASVLIFPYLWYARFVPQVWLLPLTAAPLGFAGRERLPRLLAALLLVCGAANVALVVAGYLPRALRQTSWEKARLDDLRVEISGPSVDFADFRSNRVRLRELGIVAEPVHNWQYALGSYIHGRTAVQAVDVVDRGFEGAAVRLRWTAVHNTTHYEVRAIQSAPAGPGGGALGVVARSTAATETLLPVPPGELSLTVASCNLLGCGAAAVAGPIQVPSILPERPIVGRPAAAAVLRQPRLLVSWIPAAGADHHLVIIEDDEDDTVVVEEHTDDDWLAVSLPESHRWRLRLIADLQGRALASEPVLFRTGRYRAPAMIAPEPGSTLRGGAVELAWTDRGGDALYEYFVARPGSSRAVARGVTSSSSVHLELPTNRGFPTPYSAIVRECRVGSRCTERSKLGWGPWTSEAGLGTLNFEVVAD